MKGDFIISQEKLETGMRGYPVGYCPTSYVDPQHGLFYLGQAIAELSHWDPLAVIDLLYHRSSSSSQKLGDFRQELESKMELSSSLKQSIRSLPRTASPMKLLSLSLLLMGEDCKKGDYREDCLNLIAKLPALVVEIIQHHAGWEQSTRGCSYADFFVHNVAAPALSEHFLEIHRVFSILHYDHGGGNLSTFVGKAVASGLEDIYGSMASAMSALAGPRHGAANRDCLLFVQEISRKLGDRVSERDLADFIRHKLSQRELIYGFGHAVLRVEDPRAAIFYNLAESFFPEDPLVRIALLMRKVVPEVLKENPKISNPYPNVDAISGVLLHAAGFSYPQYYTLLFGLSRMVGIAIQIVYERLEARGGKGTPIVRPKYLFLHP